MGKVTSLTLCLEEVDNQLCIHGGNIPRQLGVYADQTRHERFGISHNTGEHGVMCQEKMSLEETKNREWTEKLEIQK